MQSIAKNIFVSVGFTLFVEVFYFINMITKYFICFKNDKTGCVYV